MVVKIKVTQNVLPSTLIKKIHKQAMGRQIAIKRLWVSECAVEIKKLILSQIGKGKSPVRSELDFEKYSPIYEKQIDSNKGIFASKKTSPVNLKLTGDMLDSLETKTGSNYFSHQFTSPIAEYHDKKGAGKKKVIRRMLPRGNEIYNLIISAKIKSILKKVIKQVIGG